MSKKNRPKTTFSGQNRSSVTAENSALSNPKSECRPLDHLATFGKRYPKAWRHADFFRSDRDELPDWPNWCYLPMGGWHAIVFENHPNPFDMKLIGDVGRLSALGIWRPTQGIYRFDSSLYQAIIETPINGDLPHEVLFHLPEWCVYIESPGMTWCGIETYGFFAHLEWDANTGRHELRLVIDHAEGLIPIPLHLGAWSLSESIVRVLAEASKQTRLLETLEDSHENSEVPVILAEEVEPMVSLVLYLCSRNAEISSGSRVPSFPEPKRTKKGMRYFPPDKPTKWDVGVRLGAALRKAYQAQSSSNGDGMLTAVQN